MLNSCKINLEIIGMKKARKFGIVRKILVSFQHDLLGLLLLLLFKTAIVK